MITLKDLLEVCSPDWLEVGKKIIEVRRKSIPEDLLDFPVENITGWDDGLTVTLCSGTSPCVCLPVRKGRKA